MRIHVEQVTPLTVGATSTPIALEPIALPSHMHQWEHRPNQSGNSITRYQCSTCHCWGRRVWGTAGRHVPPVQAYEPVRMEPKPKWGSEPWPQVVSDEEAAEASHRREGGEQDDGEPVEIELREWVDYQW